MRTGSLSAGLLCLLAVLGGVEYVRAASATVSLDPRILQKVGATSFAVALAGGSVIFGGPTDQVHDLPGLTTGALYELRAVGSDGTAYTITMRVNGQCDLVLVPPADTTPPAPPTGLRI